MSAEVLCELQIILQELDLVLSYWGWNPRTFHTVGKCSSAEGQPQSPLKNTVLGATEMGQWERVLQNLKS